MKYFVDKNRIVDEFGRERIFKGVNLCFKKANLRCSTITKMLDMCKAPVIENGVNIIRLGVTWAGIEPKENQLDEDKILVFRDFVDWCADNDIEVLLDMHQDLFTNQGRFGDGAPKWAIDSSIKEISPLAIWAEGYFYMDSVQQEFYDFWTNKNGIQDKFVDAWVRFADYFSECENVVGYDYLNEPYPYKNGRSIFLSLLTGLVEYSFGKKIDAQANFEKYSNRRAFVKTVIDIAKVVKTPKRLKKMICDLDDYDTFGRLQDDFDSYIDDFNSNYYQPFFDRMRNALGDRLSFFEHNYYSNMGVDFDIEADGAVYSPHAYDIFIDTPMYNKSSTARITYILDKIKANQERMGAPVIFGEWGGGCKRGTGWLGHIDYVYNVMERNKWSNIYWSYQFDNERFVNIMNRPYPVAVCGEIIEYHSDSEERTFVLRWAQDKEYSVPTVIYTPNGVVELDGKIGENEYKINY